jgi:hypothetical protein
VHEMLLGLLDMPFAATDEASENIEEEEDEQP